MSTETAPGGYLIPQEFEESQRLTTSLGWTDPRKSDGQLMFEARFPREVIDAERARLGASGFAGQHQDFRRGEEAQERCAGCACGFLDRFVDFRR